ncbi:hypothetical protein FV226_11100 [Methylobacterium sp. WL12]|uniref:hypothetical protein n=1 Tax=Methylobacterium sp. WL12 TaxID=2603890 RepID=UPI0011CBA359|nr:hypothetical protein [Methylobacterium sp. WL12]TXM72887.1 hypothetical protein FV226_11100 [Methylobacterium sp. WL12]
MEADHLTDIIREGEAAAREVAFHRTTSRVASFRPDRQGTSGALPRSGDHNGARRKIAFCLGWEVYTGSGENLGQAQPLPNVVLCGEGIVTRERVDDDAAGRASVEAHGQGAVAGGVSNAGAQNLTDTGNLAAEVASHGTEVGHAAPPTMVEAPGTP